ncbi:MAG: hypothetical protein AAF489_05010, partial [Bacteroidota bacterium]
MKKTLLLLFLIFVSSLGFGQISTPASGQTSEKDNFKNAKKINTAKVWLEYFENYHPNGKYISKAKKKSEDIVWEYVKNNNSVKSSEYNKLSLYLKYFFDGTYQNEARLQKANISDSEFKKIKESTQGLSDQIWSTKEFLSNYPDTSEQDEAKQFLIDIEEQFHYESILSKRDRSDLSNYIKQNRAYSKEGLIKLYELIKEQNTIASYQFFINNHPSSIYDQELKKVLAEKIDTKNFNEAKRINTISAWETYVKMNKEGKKWNEGKRILDHKIAEEKSAYEMAILINTRGSLNAYLMKYPQGKYADQVKKMVLSMPKIQNIDFRQIKNNIEISFDIDGSSNELMFLIRPYYSLNGTDYVAIKSYEVLTNDLKNSIVKTSWRDDRFANSSYSGEPMIVFNISKNNVLIWNVLKDLDSLEGNLNFKFEIIETYTVKYLNNENTAITQIKRLSQDEIEVSFSINQSFDFLFSRERRYGSHKKLNINKTYKIRDKINGLNSEFELLLIPGWEIQDRFEISFMVNDKKYLIARDGEKSNGFRMINHINELQEINEIEIFKKI